LRLPPHLAIQEVRGPEVADWSIETDPPRDGRPAVRRLVIALKKSLSTAADVEVHGLGQDRRLSDPLELETPEPLGVVRETGVVAVAAAGPYQVRDDAAENLVQINRTGLQLPTALSAESALVAAYRSSARPWRLRLHVERRQARVEITDRTAVGVTARQVSLRCFWTATVSGAAVRTLTLRLPDALRVSQVGVPAGADWFVDREGQNRRLRVELAEPVLGQVDVSLGGSLARDARQHEVVVPPIPLEDAAAQRGQMVIYLDDDLEAVLSSDGGARAIDPAALDARLRLPGKTPRYAFDYRKLPGDVRLRTSATPSRASADVTTVISVRDGAVVYVSQIDYEIRQAGQRQFQVTTPEWLGADLELRGDHIRQIRSHTADGRRTWEVELQQPALGHYRLELMQTLPAADDGAVPAAVVQPLGVERARNHLVYENLTGDEITPRATRGVTPVPVAEVPAGLDDSVRRRTVAAYRVVDDAAELVWQRRVRQQETALGATISLADLTTVVLADGSYRARAIYSIRNATLQFLEVELPSQSQVWSVHVSNQPVHPATLRRSGRTLTLLPLEKTSAGDLSSKVVLLYSGDLGAALGRWTSLRLPAPQIVSPVPVSRTLWTVMLPRQYSASVVVGQSNLEEVAANYQQEERKLSFLDDLRQLAQVASSSRSYKASQKARENLGRAGAAVNEYAQEENLVNTRNAYERQGQARQLAGAIQRLESPKDVSRGLESATPSYFGKSKSAAGASEADLERDLDKLNAQNIVGEPRVREMQKAADDPFAPQQDQRRGELRKRAAGQIAQLQTANPEAAAATSPAGPQQGTPARQPAIGDLGGFRKSAQVGMSAPGVFSADLDIPFDERASAAAVSVQLPLDLDVTPVGTAHHFSKLQGEPRLTLSARHEDFDRGLVAALWAGLCLTLAGAAAWVLRRPGAAAMIARGWPWLAAAAGTAWLFLLPGGVFGLVLTVIALCVLAGRLQGPTPAAGKL